MCPESASQETAVAAQTKRCPQCGAGLESEASSGYCPGCAVAWVRCTRCQTPVDRLWRFCPADKTPIATLPLSTAREWKLGAKEPGVVRFAYHQFWGAPLHYAGYLWLVALNGQVLRLSPRAKTPGIVEDGLSAEFGTRPAAVIEDDSAGRPVLAVVGPTWVGLMDPAVHQTDHAPMRSPELTGGARFVSLSDGCPGIAGHGGRLACLMRATNGSLHLVVWQRGEKSLRTIEARGVGFLKAAGPFVLNGMFAFYTESEFFWLDGTELRRVGLADFSRGFRPVTDLAEPTPLPIAWGRLPYVPFPKVTYVPGWFREEPCMATLSLDNGQPGLGHSPMGPDEQYRPGPQASLIVTGERRFEFLRRGIRHDVLRSAVADLCAGPAVAHENLQAALFSTRGGLELRLYPGDLARVRLPVAGVFIPLDLYWFPGFLTLTALVDRVVEAWSWPLT